MTLTPEQRAAAIEAVVLAVTNLRRVIDGYARLEAIPAGAIGYYKIKNEAEAALDAALPIIEAALVSDKPGFLEQASDKPGGPHAQAGE